MQTALELLQRRPAMVIHAVGPDDAVIDAIRMMDAHDIGAVLVMQGTRLAGILSERDYARKIALLGRSSADTPVRDIMTAELHTVAPDDSIEHCMQVVTDGRIRHLPVVEDGAVMGVISIGDLVKAVIEQQRQELDQLQQYIVSG